VTAATAPGWWRRNRWGLLAFLPALALVIGMPVHDEIIPQYWDHTPHDAITAAAGEWVTYDGARMRLASLATGTVADFGGAAVSVPSGLAVWHAVLDFRSSKPDALGGCTITVRDTAGHRYAGDPEELSDLGADLNFIECAPDDDTKTTWSEDVYFLLPSTAKPVSIRIVELLRLPHYAELAAPGS
jgi:hypothetical protein